MNWFLLKLANANDFVVRHDRHPVIGPPAPLFLTEQSAFQLELITPTQHQAVAAWLRNLTRYVTEQRKRTCRGWRVGGAAGSQFLEDDTLYTPLTGINDDGSFKATEKTSKAGSSEFSSDTMYQVERGSGVDPSAVKTSLADSAMFSNISQ